MNAWYVIPALLGLTVTVAIWAALRLILGSRAPQNIAGAVMLAAMAGSMMGYLYQLVINNLDVMLAWEKVHVVCINLVYPAWLIFILLITGNGKKVTPLLVSLLACISAFPIIMFFLPSTTGWFAKTTGIGTVGLLYVLIIQNGWGVWVSTILLQMEAVIGIVCLTRQMRRVRPGYQRYTIALFLSQAIPFTAILMEIFGLNPLAPISIFNLSFIPACLFASWAIFSLRVGQTLPLMREKVVETMHDSVIVLDDQNRAAYLNPAAREMFSMLPDQSEEKTLAELSSYLPLWKAQGVPFGTITIGEMIYSSSVSNIEDWKGDILGKVIVLRNVTDQEQMEITLQKRATELTRLNMFTQSLSLLAARVAASADLNQVYNTLRDELHGLSLEFCIGLRRSGQSGYFIEYLSLDQTTLQVLEKIVGLKGVGFYVPELGEISGPNVVEEAGVIFVPEIIEIVQLVFKRFPKNFEETLRDMAGITLQIPSLTFRLMTQDENIGFLSIWGKSLHREDISALSTFAAQVSAAIQKTRLIQNEQERVSELERTNRFILSLTQVASRFEADLDMDQVIEILGAELKKLDATCVLAFIDPDTDELVGHYTSGASAIWRVTEKLTGVTLKDFRIPYKDWQEMDPGAAGPAVIINDPVEYSHKILNKIPKTILKQAIEMVGITPQTPAIWLPLRASGRNIGILAIWGIRESHKYLSVFPLFATQVATAIEKARLMKDLESLKSFNERIVQGVAEAIVLVNPEGQIIFANPSAGKLVGLPIEGLVGKRWDLYLTPADGEKVRTHITGLQAGSVATVELNIVHLEGKIIPVLAHIQTIYQEDQSVNTLVSLMDIQQRIEAEQQIRASIEEKEALLKEIHHRVKNNLQIVTSLLSLQASRIKDSEMLDAFRESQNRVRSMALIHEKLYRSNNLARIRFDEYIIELTHYLIRIYNESGRNIHMEVKADPVNLDIDTAIPCGLIINELVTNSLKHGFPSNPNVQTATTGRISVSMVLLPEHHIKLNIEDNGLGFPENLDYRKTSSLGLQLVTSLTNQLGGEVSFKTNNGARVELDFTSNSAYLS